MPYLLAVTTVSCVMDVRRAHFVAYATLVCEVCWYEQIMLMRSRESIQSVYVLRNVSEYQIYTPST